MTARVIKDISAIGGNSAIGSHEPLMREPGGLLVGNEAGRIGARREYSCTVVTISERSSDRRVLVSVGFDSPR